MSSRTPERHGSPGTARLPAEGGVLVHSKTRQVAEVVRLTGLLEAALEQNQQL